MGLSERLRFLEALDGWSTVEGGLGRLIASGLEVEGSAVEVENLATRGRRVLPPLIGRRVSSSSSSEEVSGERSYSSST